MKSSLTNVLLLVLLHWFFVQILFVTVWTFLFFSGPFFFYALFLFLARLCCLWWLCIWFFVPFSLFYCSLLCFLRLRCTHSFTVSFYLLFVLLQSSTWCVLLDIETSQYSRSQPSYLPYLLLLSLCQPGWSVNSLLSSPAPNFFRSWSSCQ